MNGLLFNLLILIIFVFLFKVRFDYKKLPKVFNEFNPKQKLVSIFFVANVFLGETIFFNIQGGDKQHCKGFWPQKINGGLDPLRMISGGQECDAINESRMTIAVSLCLLIGILLIGLYFYYSKNSNNK